MRSRYSWAAVQPQAAVKASAKSMPGLSKAQLYSAQRKHKTAAPTASPACVKFCHFAAVSAPALGLVLEHLQGQGAIAGAGSSPSRCCTGSQQGWWVPETLPLCGREKPWELEAPLVSAPAGLTLCTSPVRHAAESTSASNSHSTVETSENNSPSLRCSWKGGIVAH